MRRANWHQFQVLTKRSSVMQYYLKEHPQPAHIWHGVSVENQQTASRIDHIRAVLGVKFVSFEPLIAPIYNANLQGIDCPFARGLSLIA